MKEQLIYVDLYVWVFLKTNTWQSPTWNLVTHCELQKLRMFPSGNVAWYCGNEFLLQKWHVGSVAAHQASQFKDSLQIQLFKRPLFKMKVERNIHVTFSALKTVKLILLGFF